MSQEVLPGEEPEIITPPAEEPEGQEPEEPEADPDLAAKLEAEQEARKKAEREAAKWRRLAGKAAKGTPVTPPEGEDEEPDEPALPAQFQTDQRILIAGGMDPELLKKLTEVALFKKLPGLIEAQTDDLFVAAKDKFEQEKRSRDAGMPAGRGSGKQKVHKNLNTPGLTREEHKALVRGSA